MKHVILSQEIKNTTSVQTIDVPKGSRINGVTAGSQFAELHLRCPHPIPNEKERLHIQVVREYEAFPAYAQVIGSLRARTSETEHTTIHVLHLPGYEYGET